MQIIFYRKEKRILEDYHRAMKIMPNKKDREEIERLKEDVCFKFMS